MKKVKLLLFALVVGFGIVGAYAFASEAVVCETTVFGKLNPSGSDTDPANFKQVPQSEKGNTWDCEELVDAHCYYYFDQAQQRYIPCPDPANEDVRFIDLED